MTWTEKRRISALLIAVTCIPIAALGWLGLRILQQDRDIERQRQRERLEVAAGRLALDIGRQLQDIEEQLARGEGIQFGLAGFTTSTVAALLYQPETPAGEAVRSSLTEAEAAEFQDAEAAEFQRHELAAAAAAYRRLAAAPGPGTRAMALVGLGRVLRQRGDRAGALDAYARLEALGATVVAGQPAALVGLQGRAKVLEAAADIAGLQQAAAKVTEALTTGRWPMDRATFELYLDMTAQWGAQAPLHDARSASWPDGRSRTEAAILLWREWRGGELAPHGRRILRDEGTPVLAMWAGGPDRPVAWLATAGELDASLRPLWAAEGLAVSLHDTDGQPVVGEVTSGGFSLTPGETRLPFVLTVGPLAGQDQGSGDTRRLVLITGLAATFLLMLGAAYGLYRTTMRELMLARQQSDFVSAVSHEFRTPLTSMRHLTDLLVSRGVTSEERKTQYYELLAHETERLHRMVESLLSFGRIEVGADAWHLEPADAGELVRGIVDEFRHEPQAKGRDILLDVEDGLPPIRADREALPRALWNLLENAAKYSEAPSSIRVFVRRDGDSLLMGVGDEGIGIPAAERERVFDKFVRGADARRTGARGVGIGLALVKRIVEAHDGSVRLESEPGRGSTFTIVLPALQDGRTDTLQDGRIAESREHFESVLQSAQSVLQSYSPATLQFA